MSKNISKFRPIISNESSKQAVMSPQSQTKAVLSLFWQTSCLNPGLTTHNTHERGDDSRQKKLQNIQTILSQNPLRHNRPTHTDQSSQKIATQTTNLSHTYTPISTQPFITKSIQESIKSELIIHSYQNPIQIRTSQS